MAIMMQGSWTVAFDATDGYGPQYYLLGIEA